jgi:hypothetical protein
MPIYYACADEARAKELCASTGGEYLGEVNGAHETFMWRSHVGLCVHTFVRYTRINSCDRLMVVYKPEQDTFGEVLCDTDASSQHTFAISSLVDAPPEIKVKYNAYLYFREQHALETKQMRFHKQKQSNDARMRTLKGKMVEVVAGRTIPKGTVGKCIWAGDGKTGPRVGIKAPDGQVLWTSADNVRLHDDRPLLAMAS